MIFFNRRDKCRKIECLEGKDCSWLHSNKHAMNIFIQTSIKESWLMFSIFSMFSMLPTFSKLTSCSPIQDGRMEQYLQPCYTCARSIAAFLTFSQVFSSCKHKISHLFRTCFFALSICLLRELCDLMIW